MAASRESRADARLELTDRVLELSRPKPLVRSPPSKMAKPCSVRGAHLGARRRPSLAAGTIPCRAEFERIPVSIMRPPWGPRFRDWCRSGDLCGLDPRSRHDDRHRRRRWGRHATRAFPRLLKTFVSERGSGGDEIARRRDRAVSGRTSITKCVSMADRSTRKTRTPCRSKRSRPPPTLMHLPLGAAKPASCQQPTGNVDEKVFYRSP